MIMPTAIRVSRAKRGTVPLTPATATRSIHDGTRASDMSTWPGATATDGSAATLHVEDE